MQDWKMALIGAGASCLLAACGDAFVATSGGGPEGSGGAPAGGGGTSAQGGKGGSSSQGGGEACAGPGTTNGCHTCLFESCQEAYCACLNNPECVQLGKCVEEGNPGEFCWQQSPNGVATAGTLAACGSVECTVCAYPTVSACDACAYEKCPAQVNACYSNGECLGYLACYSNCINGGGTVGDCSNTCYGSHMAGVSDAAALADCLKSSCIDPCAAP
jgi:hypothetical protein